MNFLTTVRERAIAVNIRKGGEAWSAINNSILTLASEGLGKGHIDVQRLDRVEVECVLEALRIQGFRADWTNESYREIYVYWTPTHR